MTQTCDVLVIGGGPAGATAAILLAEAGWSVVLAERKVFPRSKVCGEYLSPSNTPLLERLGVGGLFREQAGPPVRRVGVFAGEMTLSAELPSSSKNECGRALSRERLDTMLLNRARRLGADVRQPATVRSITRQGEHYECTVERDSGGLEFVPARIVIAAHGSWDPGTLPTQPPRLPPAPSDLLGFKAHFQGSDLPPGLMPLLAFPGGYGGMVHCDGDRVSLSCCVRRDRLKEMRRSHPGDAGDAVLAAIDESCLVVRIALRRARRDGPWLAAGPIRPGIRLRGRGGIFLVGNAAGEVHPVIAEGISIAIQSAWLLCGRLIVWHRRGGRLSDLSDVARAYAGDWRRHFVPRLYVSQLVAEWAMRPAAVTGALPLLRCFPGLLTCLARWSGKGRGRGSPWGL